MGSRQTSGLLKQKNDSLEEFTVRISMKQKGSSIHEYTPCQMLDITFYDSDEIEGMFGYARFLLYDATEQDVLDIRDIAAEYGSFQYETLSSVHIMQNEEQALIEEYSEEKEEQTVPIWGRILVLKKWCIQEKAYKTEKILLHTFHMLFSILRNVGLDWVLVNPNITEEQLKARKYPVANKEQYEELLVKLHMQRTKGKLQGTKVCYCYYLQG